uniref:SEA domain-containing protein n=1 Tax=Biomphalaria glabrata TaxID=6526 RepID=A0A2C9KKS1_BIOGL
MNPRLEQVSVSLALKPQNLLPDDPFFSVFYAISDSFQKETEDFLVPEIVSLNNCSLGNETALCVNFTVWFKVNVTDSIVHNVANFLIDFQDHVGQLMGSFQIVGPIWLYNSQQDMASGNNKLFINWCEIIHNADLMSYFCHPGETDILLWDQIMCNCSNRNMSSSLPPSASPSMEMFSVSDHLLPSLPSDFSSASRLSMSSPFWPSDSLMPPSSPPPSLSPLPSSSPPPPFSASLPSLLPISTTVSPPPSIMGLDSSFNWPSQSLLSSSSPMSPPPNSLPSQSLMSSSSPVSPPPYSLPSQSLMSSSSPVSPPPYSLPSQSLMPSSSPVSPPPNSLPSQSLMSSSSPVSPPPYRH